MECSVIDEWKHAHALVSRLLGHGLFPRPARSLIGGKGDPGGARTPGGAFCAFFGEFFVFVLRGHLFDQQVIFGPIGCFLVLFAVAGYFLLLRA